MAVIVEVPDTSTARLARRLVARRVGVRVVVTGAEKASPANSSTSSGAEADRRIVVGLPESENGNGTGRHLGLLRQGIWAVVPDSPDDINRLLKGYVDDVRAGLCPLLTEISGNHTEVIGLVEELRRRPRARSTRSSAGAENPLSERETEILQLISHGVTSREIADEMGFQLQTVKNKVTVILTKTHARSRTHAVSIALNQGWISSS
jgi:DNA-binding CsgD family transcriptional regulator